MKKIIRRILQQFGYDIVKNQTSLVLPHDFEDIHKKIFNKVKANTMTSPERIYGLIEAIKYIETNNIEGDIVECGVWKGGSMMAVAEMLLHMKNINRELFLYDTFEGMPPPGAHDKDFKGDSAEQLLKSNPDKEENFVWAYSTLEIVKEGMKKTGYDEKLLHYIKGKVEETIPSNIPKKIALLRLDTDWYESTKHELSHLFPILVNGGVLILDDYGYWAGAKKAVDEYINENNLKILLSRIDVTGRIAIKQEV